ncbi:amino acid adenylation domain-containing protein [Fictibacillus fluitans]|uniref:Amino acid adenylation domain-containing protein n=1 Tax=Fictibacillus fluitans TaxID=3058422 RepID=A0ABT8HTJ4_9BACL|nr:amino acid adenylation domain-containing protein [Fictibacillus sp. NE201]MDN4524091.1 amino acid adenylation domain-containing protein [Fictibacillus sp. NE201]
MEIKQRYETSSAQRRLFIQQQFNPESTAYNLPAVFKMEGLLDIEKLNQAFQKLIERHESMRTFFEIDLDNSDISQIVEDEVPFSLEMIKSERNQLNTLLEDLVRPFHLEKGPLFRSKIIDVGDDSYYLFFDIHHIIADGTSIQNIIREVVLLYENAELPPVDVQYIDFVMWQNDLADGEEFRKQEAYWMEQFKDELPVLNLQTDYQRPAQKSGVGKYIRFHLEEVVVESLKDMARQEDTTLYMVLFSLYTTLLYRYTDQNDMVIGTPIAGRRDAQLEAVIGMFVNTLAIRVKPKGEMTFRQLLREVKDITLAAYENQDFPLDQLAEKLDINRSSDRHPMFDTMFVLQNMDIADAQINGLTIQPHELPSCGAKFDITLELTEIEKGLSGKLEYNTDLFSTKTAERLAGHFAFLAHQAAAEPDTRLHDCELLGEQEKEDILAGFNQAPTEFPKASIAELFEEQVERHPQKPAIRYHEKFYTYRQLNEKANQLAHTLQAKGIGPGKAVGIIAERSLELIVGMLGVTKTGAAYVPVEPDYPAQRIQHMLEDSGSNLLLMHGTLQQELPPHIKVLDLLDNNLYHSEKKNPVVVCDPDETAVIIFTSGTTGRPKGIMIKHRGVSRLVKQARYVELNEETRMLQTCSLGFDVFTFETWAPLLNGGELYLVEKELYLDAERLKPFLAAHKINFMVPTTALFNHLVNQDPETFFPTGTIIVGGEAMSLSHVRLLQQYNPTVTLMNGYGPAECTTYSTVYKVGVSEKGSIPLGKPITSTVCYILDSSFQPVPVGVAGELFVGGDGLSAGYSNRPELTQEKFIKVPAISQHTLYRSGDLVKWQEDGNIVYLGRRDDQVKIRGYRIELDEIKQQISNMDEILETFILPIKTVGKDTRLCAYYTAKRLIAEEEVRSHLKKHLPDFMMPELYVQLDQMPLSPNNKVNRKELPVPNQAVPSLHQGVVSWKNDIERLVAEVWQEVLSVEAVKPADNFFVLGGHSLKATLTVAKLRKALDLELGLNDLFANPTVEALAVCLMKKKKVSLPDVKVAEKKALYPATSQQTRMYVLEKSKRVPDTSHNITDLHWIDGPLNIEHLNRVLQQLIDRHDSLRISYCTSAEGVMFKVHDTLDYRIEVVECTEEQVPEQIQKFIRPYSMTGSPLFRIGLIRVAPEKHLLIFDIHHSISDGYSLGLLAYEFMTLFQGGQLHELKYQYKDYVMWQRVLNTTDYMAKQEQFWLNSFKGRLPILNLPLDYTRPAEKTFVGDSTSFMISEELTLKLKELAISENTTLYMVLLTAYYMLLHKYSGAEDIVIGAPVAGRNQAEFQDLFGLFVNTLPFRNYPMANKIVHQFLKDVSESTIQAFEHQDYQLEQLLAKLKIKPSANRNPLFDTIFVLQNMDIPPFEVEGLHFNPYSNTRSTSILDIILIAKEDNGRLYFTFEYCTNLFKKETVSQMQVHFERMLEIMAGSEMNMTIGELELDPQEKAVPTINTTETFTF